MLKLPVIVGFGGVNAAGRASFHHGHNRMVFDALGQDKQQQTLQSLSALMGVEAAEQQFILDNSLIRKISESHFDTTSIPWNRKYDFEALVAIDRSYNSRGTIYK